MVVINLQCIATNADQRL